MTQQSVHTEINEKPSLFLIDLDYLENPIEQIEYLTETMPTSDKVIHSDGKFIYVSQLVQESSSTIPKAIRQLLNKKGNQIYLQGLSKKIETDLIKQCPEFNFFTKFSYNQTIHLRIITEDNVKRDRKENTILLFDTIDSLKTVISQKGESIANKTVKFIQYLIR